MNTFEQYYGPVIPVWEAQVQEYNRRAENTLLLAERFNDWIRSNPMQTESVATGSFPSEYFGQIDVDGNQKYGKLKIVD